MPPNPQALRDLQRARTDFVAARQARAARLGDLATREATLSELQRTRAPGDPDLQNAEAARTQARTVLRVARTAEQTAKEDVLQKLEAWLAGFASDDLEEVGELEAKFPLVLLPARLETRFMPLGSPTELLVRIYPDEIFAEGHDPTLTQTEYDAAVSYWKTAWTPSDEPEAWRRLVRRYPSQRAAWIVDKTAPTNLASRPAGSPTFPPVGLRPASWARAVEATLLPDRWMVLAYRGGVEVRRAMSKAVLDPLALSFDPLESDPSRLVDISGDGLTVDADVEWMVEFRRAESVGMAVRMRNLKREDIERGFDRVLAVGVKASLAPSEAGDRLSQLFTSHHYAGGLAFVPQGTPTNNTPEAPSGFPPPDPGGTESYRVERTGLQVTPDSDGTRFMRALGLGQRMATQLPHIAGANRGENQASRAMNLALWPVTVGYYLEQMLAPGLDQAGIAAVRDYFLTYVRGRGPYPAFRVEGTPYGLLPVSSLVRWRPASGATGPEAKLPPILTPLRTTWTAQAKRVARVGRTQDPDADLLDVLSMDASAREVRVRPVWGEDFLANLFQFYGMAFFGVTPSEWSAWDGRRHQIAQGVRRLLDQMGWSDHAPAPPDPRVARAASPSEAYRFRLPLVAPDPLSEDTPLRPIQGLPGWPNQTYLEWIQGAPILAPTGISLWRDNLDTATLLYLVLRHAMLLEYARAALDILIRNQLAVEADRREPELIGIPLGPAGATMRPPLWERFMPPVPAVTGNVPLGEFLVAGGRPETSATDAYRRNLDLLKRLPSAELERLFTETFDVCSHRFDAWVTSLVTQRLEAMRDPAAEPEHCHVGAFAWVEGVRPARDTYVARTLGGRTVYVQKGSGGYVHAPSLTHAAAAAVLLNGHLTRAAESAKPFALNLSSARVRTARSLLDAVRQGQSLGAILGYRFERGLHDRGLEKYIAPLRTLYPLVAYKNQQTVPSSPAVESVSARNVADGLSLWRAAQPFASVKDPTTGQAPTPAELSTLNAEVERIRETLDGVADLLTAESVYQLIRGNAATAVASLDAMGRGVRPPDPEVAQAPGGGVPLTHRVAVVLGGGPVTLPAGWPATTTPRAQVEPYLDAWLGTVFGDPRTIKCRATYPAPTPTDPARRLEVEVTLAELGLQPIDFLAVVGQPVATGQAGELDRRVAEVALKKAPSTTKPEELRIIYAPSAAWDRAKDRSFFAAIELARAVRTALGGARPLKSEDLLPPEEVGESDTADRRLTETLSRATTARTALVAAGTALDAAVSAADATALSLALKRASLFGVPGGFQYGGAVPELIGQARSVRTEITRRSDEAGSLLSKAAQQIAAPLPKDERAIVTLIGEAVEAIFGRGFVFLPRFTPASSRREELALALAAGAAFGSRDPHAGRKWFDQAARVRASLGRWRKSRLYATAIGGLMEGFEVAQLPYADGARWVALPHVGNAPHPPGRLSLVSQRPSRPAATDPWVGLLLDEWAELIPHATAPTGVMFHYDDPGAEAAQAVLVAVPPDPTARVWDPASLVDVLQETLDLATARLVEGEHVGDLGQLVPALYLAFNAPRDTVSTDFGPFRQGETAVVP